MKRIVGKPDWWHPDLEFEEILGDIRAGYKGKDLHPVAKAKQFKRCSRAEIFCRLVGEGECTVTMWIGNSPIPERYYFDMRHFADLWIDHPQAIPLHNSENVTLFLEADHRGVESLKRLKEHARLVREGKAKKKASYPY